MKKIIALNGSGRKNGNSASILKAFLEGVQSTGEDLAVEYVDIFDLDYKGCRGCQGCILKTRKGIGCVQQDGASTLLQRMREADGLVFASPVYFWELSAQLRALLERYIYPGALDHHQEIMTLYTMYQPERVSDIAFTPHMDTIRGMMYSFLYDVEVNELLINDTQTWEPSRGALYLTEPEKLARSAAIHAQRWEGDLAAARQAGIAFVQRILEE